MCSPNARNRRIITDIVNDSVPAASGRLFHLRAHKKTPGPKAEGSPLCVGWTGGGMLETGPYYHDTARLWGGWLREARYTRRIS